MECSAAGVIPASREEELRQLLRALSGAEEVPLREHEMRLRTFAEGTGRPGHSVSEIRLVCDYTAGSEPSWRAIHLGYPVRSNEAQNYVAAVRQKQESKVGKNALSFFTSIGFRFDFELLRVGFSIEVPRDSGVMVCVSTVHKLTEKGKIETAVPLQNNSTRLVEVTARATVDSYADSAARIASLGEVLKPIVQLSRATPPSVAPQNRLQRKR
mmetsp:Transcript_13347/g.48584  ORF Transcript_13347/g.48584 Transcript_13347/m.48584 type:complete len:213 (-) Transcript_13347:291-929(-)